MNPSLEVDEAALRRRYRFARLVRPQVGLFETVFSLRQEPTVPPFEIGTTSLGNLAMVLPGMGPADGLENRDGSLGGAGSDADAKTAWIRAVVEGAERYCTIVHKEEDFVVASARELGDSAMDLATIPRLSTREYADPQCPFIEPDPAAPIRWTRGYSLIEHREVLLPSVMTHLYTGAWSAERFWQSISTGVAAHTALASALVNAINEIIERDAIALTWLCRRPLPRIVVDSPPAAPLAVALERLEYSQVRHLLFDATTDLGIPTVYALQLADGHPFLSQIVNCATDFDPASACAKTIREIAAARTAFQSPREQPEDPAEFTSLFDGASYLGRPERRSAFDFLLESPGRRALSAMRIPAPIDDRGRLAFLLRRLAEHNMSAFAVDLTTDEVREAGLWVVRVVIPQALPMSSIHRARYLGHPRLRQYLGVTNEAVDDSVNPDPQPFA